MKKRIISVVSLLLALVMSFALIACGNDDGENTDGDWTSPPNMTSAISKLVNADGIKGDAVVSFSSNKNALTESAFGMEKRGDRVLLSMGEGITARSLIADVKTGYVYLPSASGYVFEQEFPANLYDTAIEMLYAQIAGQDLSAAGSLFTLDYAKRTATLTIDEADRVNTLLAPLLTSYKGGNRVNDLINNYLKLFSPDPTNPITLDDVLDMVKALAIVNADMTLDEVIEMAENNGIDLYGIIEDNMGVEIDDEMRAAIETRTLAQALVGLNGVVPDIIQSVGNGEEITEEVVLAIINAAFFKDVGEITDEAYENAVDNFTNVIYLWLCSMKVRDVVDEKLGGADASDLEDTLYEIIKNSVRFDKLNAEIVFAFDKNDDIKSVTVNANVKHSYSGSDATSALLSDNNYALSVAVNIEEYLTNPEDFETEFSPYSTLGYSVVAVTTAAELNTAAKISVYYETGDNDTDITSLTEYMTFDKQTSSFVFDTESVAQYYADEIANGTFKTVIGMAGVDGTEQTVIVVLSVVDDTPQSLLELIFEYFDVGGSDDEITDDGVIVGDETWQAVYA